MSYRTLYNLHCKLFHVLYKERRMFMFHLKTNEVVTPSQLADVFQVKTLKQSRFIKETPHLFSDERKK